jgi:DNA modification methylase
MAPATPKPSAVIDTRVIYCGDNLDQLKKLPDACVDLIYIDPPFNSNRNYEVFWGETKEKRAFKDRHASTQAYVEFMRPRCVELHRVLKKTGSFYYHCDWHASHYVKVMLDQILGETFFQNEIVWKRTNSHNDANRFGIITDRILFYSASKTKTFNRVFTDYSEEQLGRYKYEDERGRYRAENLTAPHFSETRTIDWRGTHPGKDRQWRFSIERLEELYREGRILLREDGTPRKDGLKEYLSDALGRPLQDLWDDIPRISNTSAERLGYPTQKPLALLERIVKASSNENDIVLDAFCGCGTALVAAQKLKRQWIGIDVSPTACRVMAKRLKKDCGLKEDEKLWEIGRGFIVRDLPKTEAELRKYPAFEFENWAVVALGGIPNKVQVGDLGIDGRIYPVSAMPEFRVKENVEMDFMDVWYPIQVKQTDKVGRPDIDAFETAMQRAKRKLGYFVGFEFSRDALFEIDRFRRTTGCKIKPLTVREILDEEVAQKV